MTPMAPLMGPRPSQARLAPRRGCGSHHHSSSPLRACLGHPDAPEPALEVVGAVEDHLDVVAREPDEAPARAVPRFENEHVLDAPDEIRPEGEAPLRRESPQLSD